MNAYVMNPDGIQVVVAGAGRVEIQPDGVALIRGADLERSEVAAVRISDDSWVVIGTHPPAGWAAPAAEALAAPLGPGEGGWPLEPPPDVDAEG